MSLVKKMSGAKKVAILLLSLSVEDAAAVLRRLSRAEVEAVTVEIANMGTVDNAQQKEILSEFYQLAQADSRLAEGGVDAAQAILEKAFDTQKAAEYMQQLNSLIQGRPLDILRKADPAQVANFIAGEHPQTIALVLAYMD
ncbi:MAG: flagellar motor switch protein FliG, partial [Firmicutes bacterium]|nr:flagellar motor switch protein FliG [Bacillota bacterium]